MRLDALNLMGAVLGAGNTRASPETDTCERTAMVTVGETQENERESEE
jgi:hypothetical protein